MNRPPAALAARLIALARPEDRSTRDEVILGALADPASPIRDVAVAWAARCLEPSRLVPLVAEEANAILRNSALAALERQGPYAVAAVERMLTESDADVAMFACQVLGAISGESSCDALLAALGRPEINVRQAAVEALGRLKARAAVPALVALLEGDPWLQLAAVLALGEIGDPAAAEPLLALVPQSFVAEPALEALRQLGAPHSLPKLVPLLLDPAQGQLRPALLGAVAVALEKAETPAELHAVADSLERDHSPGSLYRFLSERLGGGEEEHGFASALPRRVDDRNQGRGGTQGIRDAGTLVLATGNASLLPLAIRWAATRDGLVWVRNITDRYPNAVARGVAALLAHSDPEVRTGSVRIMKPSDIGVDRLLAALEDPDVRVRIAAMETLRDLGDGQAAVPIARRLTSEDSAEREAATRALSRLPVPAVEEALAPLLAEGAPESSLLHGLSVLAGTHLPALEDRVLQLATKSPEPVHRLALRAAAKIPGSRAEVLLLRALANRDPSVQVEALDLLVGRGGHRVLTTLLALLAVADSLRYHVIRALGRLGVAKAAAPLEALFPSAPLHEQLEILAALATLGAGQCQPFLTECLGHSNGEIRRAAARSLADLAGPSDLDLFRRLASDSDWVMRSEAARALGRLRLPEGRPALLDLARDLEPAVSRTARAALAGAS